MGLKRIFNALVSSVVFFSIITASPTLEDLTALQCGSDKPFKCLPYGVCYHADQFCHAGLVESCFPKNITTDQLENWCKTTGQFRPEMMRDPKLCALACQARFPSLNLSNALDHLVNKTCPHDRPLKCLPDGICHGYDEYCDAGRNKSCFDESMSEKELLQWCQDIKQNDVSVFPQLSCIHACQARFPSLPRKGYKNLIWFYVLVCAFFVVGAVVTGVLTWTNHCRLKKFTEKLAPGNETAGEETDMTLEMMLLLANDTRNFSEYSLQDAFKQVKINQINFALRLKET